MIDRIHWVHLNLSSPISLYEIYPFFLFIHLIIHIIIHLINHLFISLIIHLTNNKYKFQYKDSLTLHDDGSVHFTSIDKNCTLTLSPHAKYFRVVYPFNIISSARYFILFL